MKYSTRQFPPHSEFLYRAEEIPLAPEMVHTPIWKNAPLAPVMLTRNRRHWHVVRCPFCEGEHDHGAGDGDPRQWLGGRMAHCHPSRFDYPDSHSGGVEYRLIAIIEKPIAPMLDLFFPSTHPILLPQHRRPLRASITGAYRDAVWLKTNGRCVYCGIQTGPFTNFAVDHIVPIARGGNNDLDNLAPSCSRCNSEKKDRTPALWRTQMPEINYRFWFEEAGIAL